MPITINISGEAVKEVKQLVHDLADTMGRMADQDMPVDTAVSTIEQPAVQAYQPQNYVTQQQAAQAYDPQSYYSSAAPVVPQTVPTQPMPNASPPTQAPPLTHLPKEQYGEFAIFLRGLGAKI